MQNKEVLHKCTGIIYRIYPVKQGINGCYIGQTRGSIKQRWQQHLNAAKHMNTNIGRAIHYYGQQNFRIQKIADAISCEQLNILERLYIRLYNSLQPGGFNLSKGGQTNIEHTSGKPVIHYQTGICYRNSVQASQATGCLSSDIRAVASKLIKSSKGNHFYWKYTPVQSYIPFWNTPDLTGPKKVLNVQTGEIFNSQKEAGIKYGIAKGSISKMVKGEIAYIRNCPYLFVSSQLPFSQVQRRRLQFQQVIKKHRNFKRVKHIPTNQTYMSMTQAARSHGIEVWKLKSKLLNPKNMQWILL